jgi:hypothetical protein
MEFALPNTNEGKLEMYSESLMRVRGGLQKLDDMKQKIAPELTKRRACGEDTKDILRAQYNIRLQELCLGDQEKRLQERIECLQTGF